MKSERLVVLLAPEEKARLVALADARESSLGELVRQAIATLDTPRKASELIRLGCEKVRNNDDGSQLWRGADGRHFLVAEPEDGRNSDRSAQNEEMDMEQIFRRLEALPEKERDRLTGALSTTASHLDSPAIDAAPSANPGDEPQLSLDQVAALERLAEIALRTMQRANAALGKAFAEVEATKAYFVARRSKEPRRELV